MSDMTKDIHVVRYCTSLVTVSGGKVISATMPSGTGCRMARFLYKEPDGALELSRIRLKERIKKVIEGKISRFGFCTKDRIVWQDEASIACGASEIMAYGLGKRLLDAAVTVCDGAGTVVTDKPQIVQGIGARMHTVIKTTRIPEVAAKLRRYGCIVPLKDGTIDQRAGAAAASEMGYKNIAVTVSAFGNEDVGMIRSEGARGGVSVVILAVCTTGVKSGRLSEIEGHADIAWSCNSPEARRRFGGKAVMSLPGISPVYALTAKGARLIRDYKPGVFGMRRSKRAGILS